MKAERGKEAVDEKCEASRGWCQRLKEKAVSITGAQSEAAGADTEAAAGDPEALAKVLHEGGYTKQQILWCVNDTAFYWKVPLDFHS